SELGYPPLPTTCGADGSYAIERLLTVDLVAAASVVVEGLVPPSEKRFWGQPRHLVFVESEPHHPDTATVLRAMMMGGEVLLAAKAPHDLVMFDGTLTLPLIYFNQAVNKAPEVAELKCAQEFLNRAAEYLEAYAEMLQSRRSDKIFIGTPKYTTRAEIGRQLGWAPGMDDRGMLTHLLKAGELTRPMPLEPPQYEWHLNVRPLRQMAPGVERTAETILRGLQQLQVFYYKPHEHVPALRIETAASVAANKHRLAVLLQGIKHQCATAAMLEPYPLYLADRMVKALARSIPTFRQVATQRVAEHYTGDIEEVFFALHGYRSESGR
ncbi:MAG: DNA double-strand break repair nuclease NurA, partial [Dethiobacteria bacterium]